MAAVRGSGECSNMLSGQVSGTVMLINMKKISGGWYYNGLWYMYPIGEQSGSVFGFGALAITLTIIINEVFKALLARTLFSC